MEDTERISYDVFVTTFHETMRESFGMYLKGLETCLHPDELLMLHTDFVLFNSRIYAELDEIVSSAVETGKDYH